MTAPANRYVHPRAGRFGRMVASVLDCATLARVRHAVMRRLPFVQMASDVRDVVYLTWLVDAAAARALLPAGVTLRERDGLTPFTILSYRHGHFGPAFFGPLRRLFPSPLQSNWRLYLEGEGAATVWFVKNIMDSLAYAAGTRLFSDIMQTHLAERFVCERRGDAVDVAIGAGQGSAADFFCSAATGGERRLPPRFGALFDNWHQAVAALALQERAIGWSERFHRLVSAEIALPVDVDSVLPLRVAPGAWHCPLLDQLGPVGEPFGFLVPAVPFRVLSERLL